MRITYGMRVVGAAVIAGCAVNPATGRRELSLVSESQEIQMGQEGARDVRASMTVYPDSEVQQYVRGLGLALAATSERPQLPWSFTVLEDPVVNAFALPGGPIFVTSGILGHMTSEAELVSVLGHEIGHVTARHSASQISKAQLATLGLGVGAILTPDLAPLHQIAGAGLGILFLKFSRDDESQADELGFRYMTRGGWDPRGAVEMFKILDRVSGGAAGRVPEWQSTHPDPENRVQKAEARVAAMTSDSSALTVHRAEYLRHIDGLIYGPNPRQGYFDGAIFHHPDLAFRFIFPDGWKTQNGAQAVVGISGGQDAIVQLSLGGRESPATVANQFTAQEGIIEIGRTSETVNGFPSEWRQFRAQTEQGMVRGLVAFIGYNGTVYQLLGYTPEGKYGEYEATFGRVIRSFQREADPAVLAKQPDRIDIVTADRAMTLAEFHRRFPSTVPVETVALINGLEPGSRIERGAMVKRVVAGR